MARRHGGKNLLPRGRSGRSPKDALGARLRPSPGGGTDEPDEIRAESEGGVTTIAWDGRMLATDGRCVSASDRILSQKVAKIQLSGELRPGETVIVSAGAGDLGDLEEYFDWMRDSRTGEWPFPKGKDEWNAEICELEVKIPGVSTLEGSRLRTSHDLRFKFTTRDSKGRVDHGCEAPYAMGSGGSYALGAMASGLSAPEAVAIACRYDVFSGGCISFFDTQTAAAGIQTWNYDGEKR